MIYSTQNHRSYCQGRLRLILWAPLRIGILASWTHSGLVLHDSNPKLLSLDFSQMTAVGQHIVQGSLRGVPGVGFGHIKKKTGSVFFAPDTSPDTDRWDTLLKVSFIVDHFRTVRSVRKFTFTNLII